MPTRRKFDLPLLRLGLYGAVVALLWMMLRGPKTAKDVLVFAVFTAAVCVVSFYSFRAVRVRSQKRAPFGGWVVFARAKSSIWFYLGVGGVWLSLLLITASLVDQITDDMGQQSRILLGFALGSFALGFLYAWLGGYQLRVSPKLVEYWSLFGGYRSMPADQVQKARIRIGEFTYKDRYRPTVRLEILPSSHHGSSDKPIVVNLKVFRKEDMDRVFDWLGPKLENSNHRTSTSRPKSSGTASSNQDER